MPVSCLSCGEFAIIEEDIEGGSVQKICIECGTVASAVKAEDTPDTNVIQFLGVKQEQVTCRYCGDGLSANVQLDICPECQELESGQMADNEQNMTAQHEKESASKNSECTPTVNTCKSCHSTNLSMDSLGADERLVCKDCGTVAGNESLMNDEFEIMSRSYRNSFVTLPANANLQRKLHGKDAGHLKIAFLHNKLCFTDFIKDEAIEMFDKVFDRSPVMYAYITTKEHIAAACVFIVCRQHNIPITLIHFRKLVDNFSVFLKGKKIVLKCLNITLPHMALSTQIEHLLVNRGFNARIMSKVTDILFLCRQAWLTQGRSREGLIIIAAYYAYVSSDVCAGFISMTAFRQMFSFPNISLLLQAECYRFFLKLACSIPWVITRNIKRSTIYKYIDDILSFQNSLMQLAFKSHDIDSRILDKNITETDQELNDKSKRKTARQTKNQHRTKRNSYDSSQKDVLLPSILKKSRHKTLLPEVINLSHVDLDSPDLNDSEFDETEISSYLLSPDEVAMLSMPKMKIMHK